MFVPFPPSVDAIRGLGAVVGNQIMITEGLEGGEIIAIAGVSFLEDGQKVKLMQPADAEGQ